MIESERRTILRRNVRASWRPSPTRSRVSGLMFWTYHWESFRGTHQYAYDIDADHHCTMRTISKPNDEEDAVANAIGPSMLRGEFLLVLYNRVSHWPSHNIQMVEDNRYWCHRSSHLSSSRPRNDATLWSIEIDDNLQEERRRRYLFPHASIISDAICLRRFSRCSPNISSGYIQIEAVHHWGVLFESRILTQCKSRMKHCKASSFQRISSLVAHPWLQSLKEHSVRIRIFIDEDARTVSLSSSPSRNLCESIEQYTIPSDRRSERRVERRCRVVVDGSVHCTAYLSRSIRPISDRGEKGFITMHA